MRERCFAVVRNMIKHVSSFLVEMNDKPNDAMSRKKIINRKKQKSGIQKGPSECYVQNSVKRTATAGVIYIYTWT